MRVDRVGISADDVVVVVGDAVGPLLLSARVNSFRVPPLVELGPHLADLALSEELLVRLEPGERLLAALVRAEETVDGATDSLQLFLCGGIIIN